MMVMTIAITASLNASRRPFPMIQAPCGGVRGDDVAAASS